MDVKDAIEQRRAYRALDPVEISDDTVRELASAAQLAPSCFNNQPWRFVFVRDSAQLAKMRGVMSKGNEWAFKASMIIAVFSKKEDDCVIKDREYHQFDTGMAVGLLILRATELGLVAHPIAGFSPKKAREVLGIPDIYQVITLINVGKKGQGLSGLSEGQREAERPERKPFGEFAYIDRFPVQQ
ncbi:MAG: nitroreductase family protein [Euryarchaeota archaeon]|nr:nitroreductase family protein [Euryarchaeota archaeon]